MGAKYSEFSCYGNHDCAVKGTIEGSGYWTGPPRGRLCKAAVARFVALRPKSGVKTGLDSNESSYGMLAVRKSRLRHIGQVFLVTEK